MQSQITQEVPQFYTKHPINVRSIWYCIIFFLVVFGKTQQGKSTTLLYPCFPCWNKFGFVQCLWRFDDNKVLKNNWIC